MSKNSSPSRHGASLLWGRFHHESATLLYVLLSVADLFVTYFLLQQEGQLQFVEANPVARFFLHRWGIKGMIYFKFGMVGVVCVVTQIIAQWKPQTARLVLWFAIVVMIYVLVYSVRLYRHHAPGMSNAEDVGLVKTVCDDLYSPPAGFAKLRLARQCATTANC